MIRMRKMRKRLRRRRRWSGVGTMAQFWIIKFQRTFPQYVFRNIKICVIFEEDEEKEEEEEEDEEEEGEDEEQGSGLMTKLLVAKFTFLKKVVMDRQMG